MVLLAPSKRPSDSKVAGVEAERLNFKALLVQNPNYFGNLPASRFKAVAKKIQGNTSYERLSCIGLNPPYDRLEAVLQVNKEQGYGGDICSPGSNEYVRFYVDIFDNGVWHDVGLAHVTVHDIPGNKPLCYAVYKDFSSLRKFCTVENIVKVRAILQWSAAPPANTPGYAPVWGNVLDAQVQIHPRKFIVFNDLLEGLQKVELPDPIGPIVEQVEPLQKLMASEVQPLTLADKQRVYARSDVPVHRFAFPEVHQLLSLADPGSMAPAGESTLVELGLGEAALGDLIVKLLNPDGDTSFEELNCVGLNPAKDTMEAVLTVKKSTGFSGQLCGKGSTEYVAFWIDFDDGTGFQYQGTATVNVHDLQALPKETVHYAVFLKKDLSKFRVPCNVGARVVRLRAILSWETAPPPGNPNFVPVWGNREECLVQLEPGKLEGHIPLIETVGDIGVDDIDPLTGLATGVGQIGSFSVVQSPFGGVVTITGRIGNPPDSFGGGAPQFKYRVEVFGPPPFDSWTPLANPVAVKITEWFAGIPVQCEPGEFVCDVTLLANDDGDGQGPGWYPYVEDIAGVNQRFLVVDKLASWITTPDMEGLWQIRITAKDPSGPPTILPGVQTVQVRIDNTPPSGPAGPGATQAAIEANPPLAITGGVFNGTPIPASDCGKFPVGTILSGTYEVHDPGTSSPNQHFGSLSIDVIPDGPANGAATVPSSRAWPVVSTNGEAGTWTLDTSMMDPCGYVLRLHAADRTNVNSTGNQYTMTYDVGFCLISPNATT